VSYLLSMSRVAIALLAASIFQQRTLVSLWGLHLGVFVCGPSWRDKGLHLCVLVWRCMTTTLETRNLFRTLPPYWSLFEPCATSLDVFGSNLRKFQDPPNHGPSPTSWYHVEAIRSLFQQRALVSLGLHLCVLVRNLF